jgi:hypothetical protein
LLWLLGRESLPGVDRWRSEASELVKAAHKAFDALRALEEGEKSPPWTSPAVPMELRAQLLAKAREPHLHSLSEHLVVLAEQGVRVPLPAYVRRHAAELGVELPGVED